MKLARTVVVGLVVGAAVLFAAQNFLSPSLTTPVTDTLSPAAAEPSPQPAVIAGNKVVAGLGIVEPASGIVELSALMPGVISAVYKAEGDPVKRGEVVAELVNDDLKALVAQAKSTVEIERARLALAEIGPRSEDIARAEALVKEEQSNTRLFEIQLKRRQALVREGAIARETLDEIRRELTASQQRRAAALKQLEILRQGSRPQELEAARASFELAEHKLSEAEALLNKSYVRSMTDGVVLRRYLQAGEALSTEPAVAVMQVADTSRLVVRTQIDENDISGLKLGQKAQITAPSLKDRDIQGSITRISPRLGAKTVTADAAAEKRDTRVLEVLVALEPGIQLPINLRVDVLIDLDSAIEQPSELRGSVDGPVASQG